jgi:VIT1/CCC1 family predicted Fe2+/Mn2+ transporter
LDAPKNIFQYLFGNEKEDGENNKQAKYLAGLTGISYLVTVLLLVIPYFIFTNVWTSLVVMLIIAILIISVYSYHMAKNKKQSFSKRFFTMSSISLSVAFVSFVIGYLLEYMFGLTI